MTLATFWKQCNTDILKYYCQLHQQGHQPKPPKPPKHLFLSDLKTYSDTTKKQKQDPIDTNKTIFIYLKYHPMDLQHKFIKEIFKKNLLQPKYHPPLHHLHSENEGRVDIKKITIC